MKFKVGTFELEVDTNDQPADKQFAFNALQSAMSAALYPPREGSSEARSGDTKPCGCEFNGMAWESKNSDWIHPLINTLIDTLRIKTKNGSNQYPNNRALSAESCEKLKKLHSEILSCRNFVKNLGEKEFGDTFDGDVGCLIHMKGLLIEYLQNINSLEEDISNLTEHNKKLSAENNQLTLKKKRPSARRKADKERGAGRTAKKPSARRKQGQGQ